MGRYAYTVETQSGRMITRTHTLNSAKAAAKKYLKKKQLGSDVFISKNIGYAVKYKPKKAKKSVIKFRR